MQNTKLQSSWRKTWTVWSLATVLQDTRPMRDESKYGSDDVTLTETSAQQTTLQREKPRAGKKTPVNNKIRDGGCQLPI